MITICCICRKTKKDSRWKKQPIVSDNEVSHGFCPDCFTMIIKKIKVRTAENHGIAA